MLEVGMRRVQAARERRTQGHDLLPVQSGEKCCTHCTKPLTQREASQTLAPVPCKRRHIRRGELHILWFPYVQYPAQLRGVGLKIY